MYSRYKVLRTVSYNHTIWISILYGASTLLLRRFFFRGQIVKRRKKVQARLFCVTKESFLLFFALRRISLSHYFSKTPLIMPFRTRPCSNKKMSQIKGYESLFPHISSRVFIQASLLPQCGILMKISEGYKISHGQSLLLDSYVATCMGGSTWHQNYTLGMDFLDHDFYLILKNLHQDLSNEGSNFILSSQEVGHWVAQQITWNYRFGSMIYFRIKNFFSNELIDYQVKNMLGI